MRNFSIGIVIGCVVVGCGDQGSPPAPSMSQAAFTAASLEVNGTNSCLVTTEGELWCWGGRLSLPGASNGGQLATHPIKVDDTDWVSAIVGLSHVCGIRGNGALWCWYTGFNAGPTLETVVEPGPWASASLGTSHQCEIARDHTLWCSGDNANGQAGTGEDSPRVGITQLGGQDWAQVSAGDQHTCAIKLDGTLWCWGSADVAQMGDADVTACSTRYGLPVCRAPVQLGGTGWSAVSAGIDYACAIKSDGTLWCWGFNYGGVLGVPDLGPQRAPVQIAGTTWSEVSASNDDLRFGTGRHTCATKTDHTLWCWGFNQHGALGSDGADMSTPIQVAGTWHSPRVGLDHTCATREDDSVWCWGSNVSGELATERDQLVPVQVPDADWTTVGGYGDRETCATKANGTAWCWGFGDDLGHQYVAPFALAGTAFTKAGDLYAQSSDATITPLVWPLYGVAPAATSGVALAAGTEFSCTLRQDRSLWCEGVNRDGQLGVPTACYPSATCPPMQVRTGVLSVAAGTRDVCAVFDDHHMECWGRAAYLDGDRFPPSASPPGSDWLAVHGGDSKCALRIDGTLWCWGVNSAGQLGDGTDQPSTVPRQVAGSHWVDVDGTCGRKDDGSLWCWGTGILGDGTVGTRALPTRIAGEWTSVRSRPESTCATKRDGSLWCWGKDHGQYQRPPWQSTPVEIVR